MSAGLPAGRPLAAVLGDPIGHSLSPRLHGFWLSEQGLAGQYLPLRVRAADLAAVLDMLPRLGFVGCNVTIPHKIAALDLAAEASPAARAIGAANTLTFLENGGFVADNTDGFGFLESLREHDPAWRAAGQVVTILGAGGAARAVAWQLLDAGAAELRLVNRTREKAEAMAEGLGTRVAIRAWDAVEAAIGDASLVVNATSLGMTGHPPLKLTLARLRPGALVVDLVYAPLRTAFLARAEARGGRPVDGLGMLLHQGRPGFRRWFGGDPQVSAALRRAVLG